MRINTLKSKASLLPLSPGVYIMKDDSGEVIYVGKAKKLKNRVLQYFLDTESHTPKTRIMVSKVSDFDVIVAASEFEALILECSLIKQYKPKYNILLKDDKGFPFVRIDYRARYPKIEMVNRVADDGASYFGPFGSRNMTQNIIKAIRIAMKLPDCDKKFPREIGNDRPCLNYHMNQCEGWCQKGRTQEDYQYAMQQVRQLLSGNYTKVAADIRKQMRDAADALNFELAAGLRDRLAAIESLGKKQIVTATSAADTDVIGYSETDSKACFTVLHFRDGNLLDKDFSIVQASGDKSSAISTLIKQYYINRGFSPKHILIPFDMEDRELFAECLRQKYSRKVYITCPQRGEKLHLIQLAEKNAAEELLRILEKDTHIGVTLEKLGNMLGISSLQRIESFDISNISGTDIVAGMVVFCNGKPKPSEYKKFKLDNMGGQDDYAAMYSVLQRRFLRYKQGDPAFKILPDLLLIDGGENHAAVAQRVLHELDISIPIFGMVKDDKHRTRALMTSDGRQISIITQQAIFSLIGKIQEETHRFAIGYHKQLRSKRLNYSQLDKIPGVGKKRKADLLKTFKSINAIKSAQLFELEQILPRDVALAVYDYFQNSEKGCD